MPNEPRVTHTSTMPTTPFNKAAEQLHEAVRAKKCWSCGCFHDTVAAIDATFPADQRPAPLNDTLRAAGERLAPRQYACLGCAVCYPALAINALAELGDLEMPVCPTDTVEAREGWPPLPGSYTVLRYQAPVAVCTLTDEALATAIARVTPPAVALVGTLQTENLGIERLILNVLANPQVRFLVVCGADSQQAIGHLPGQSLIALAQAGLNDRARIAGARGKRPVLRNVSADAVQHFRSTVEVIDLVGHPELSTVLEAVRACAARDPGPAPAFAPERVVSPLRGYRPQRMVPDTAGYFVLFADHIRGVLSLEHYRTDGVLDTIIEGREAAELYIPAIDQGLVSRLDHAAYLGRELARAEHALRASTPYVQDAAPEHAPAPVDQACQCGPACEDVTS